MNKLLNIFISGVLLICPTIHYANVIHVPGDSVTIQAGINGADNGDTVLVAPGTYTGEGNWDIDFGGKNIVLLSENGPEETIIDCSDSEILAFYFHNGEDTTAVLEGFSITGSVRWYCYGSGIWCDSSSPTIRDNILFDNHCMGWLGAGCPVAGRGGAIYCTNSNAVIVGNIIRDNSASSLGGGIYCQNSNLQITGNSFINNYLYGCAWGDTALGCALYCENSNPNITNNIFWANKISPQIYDLLIYIDETSAPAVTCNDIKGGGNSGGNINADPLFCNPETDDYRIEEASPCAPSNNECGVLIGALDIGCTATDVVNESKRLLLARNFILSQNYPNPFNMSTSIEFSLPARSEVELAVYNILGQRVKTLLNESEEAGYHSVQWDGTDNHDREVASGIYFYRLKTGEFTQSKKMILLK